MKSFVSIISVVLCLSTIDNQVRAQWVQTSGYTGWVNCFTVKGTNVFSGTVDGVFISSDNGASWNSANNGVTGTLVYSLAVSGAYLFAGTVGGTGGVFMSTNDGTNWSDRGLMFLDVYALATMGSYLYAGTNLGVYLSDNNGLSWTAVNSGLTNTHVLTLALSGTTLFVGTNGGGIFRSTNDGASWTATNVGLTNSTTLTFAVSGGNIFAGTYGGGVFMSSNNGVSWLEENSGLTNRTTDALAASGAIVLDGSNGDGVFVSTNNASTWNASNSGLTRGIVSALLVHGLDVLAGSDAGIWRRPLLEMTSVRPPTSAIVKAFGLNQNFPNPFNPSTTISYQLPSQCRITLKIYDVLGREVTTLVNGIETPGYKSTVWDAGGVASGVYYYRLQAGDFVQTKKLSVVK